MELLDLKTSEIISNALQKLNTFSNITFLSPGSKARMLVDILSEEIGLQAAQFDSNIGAGLLREAKGNTLDYIGEVFGLERLQEVRSQIYSSERNFSFYTIGGTFGNINNEEDILIKAGTVQISNSSLFSSEDIIYRNKEDIILKANEDRVFFSAHAITSGSNANAGSNTLIYHNFKGYADSFGNSLAVSNSNSITYGRDRESDENYRYRIQKEKISSEAGNETSIRLALLVIPGIANIVQIPYSRGIGTCDWLISSSSVEVSDELLNTAQRVIGEKQSVGMSNIARAPVLIGIEFIFSLTYRGRLEDKEKENIRNIVKNNVSSYVNNLSIAEPIILDQIVRIVLSSSDQIESMGDADSSSNFQNVFLYKRTQASNSLTRKSLIGNYNPKSYERVTLETSISNPITIIDNN